MNEFIGGGLQVGRVAYHVSRMPIRKRVQLFRWEGINVLAVAEFRDEKHAADFLKWLQSIADHVHGTIQEAKP